jgi:hypothetical protein
VVVLLEPEIIAAPSRPCRSPSTGPRLRVRVALAGVLQAAPGELQRREVLAEQMGRGGGEGLVVGGAEVRRGVQAVVVLGLLELDAEGGEGH